MAKDIKRDFRFVTIYPDGREVEGTVRWSPEPTVGEIRAFVLPELQAQRDDAYYEHVRVLYKGNPRASMFVDDFGNVDLPPNPKATEVYHAASKARGEDMSNASPIYGVAILFEDNAWH